MTWAISACRLGELLTFGDVYHLRAERGDAERCGVLVGGTPELVRLGEVRPAVYRVVWSLSRHPSEGVYARPKLDEVVDLTGTTPGTSGSSVNGARIATVTMNDRVALRWSQSAQRLSLLLGENDGTK